MATLETLPDAVSLKTRFPEFASQSDAAVAFAIQEAARSVDDTWIEGDQILAVTLLAAHYLAVARASASTGGRVITSEHIGEISTTYANLDATSQNSLVATTTYGQRYQSLLSKSHPPVILI